MARRRILIAILGSILVGIALFGARIPFFDVNASPQSDYAAAQAALGQANTNLTQAKATLDAANKAATDAAAGLGSDGTTTQQTVDRAVQAQQAAQTRYNSALAAQQAADKQFETAQAILSGKPLGTDKPQGSGSTSLGAAIASGLNSFVTGGIQGLNNLVAQQDEQALRDAITGGAATAQPAANAKPAADSAKTSCTTPKGAIIDPCVGLGENLTKLYSNAAVLVFPLAFLVLIYAGYLFLTSGGNQNQVGEAKAWLIAALTGVLLYILIPAILAFIGTNSSGGSPTPSTTPAPPPAGAPVDVPQTELPA